MLPNHCQTSTNIDISTFLDTINHLPKVHISYDIPATDKLIHILQKWPSSLPLQFICTKKKTLIMHANGGVQPNTFKIGLIFWKYVPYKSNITQVAGTSAQGILPIIFPRIQPFILIISQVLRAWWPTIFSWSKM